MWTKISSISGTMWKSVTEMGVKEEEVSPLLEAYPQATESLPLCRLVRLFHTLKAHESPTCYVDMLCWLWLSTPKLENYAVLLHVLTLGSFSSSRCHLVMRDPPCCPLSLWRNRILFSFHTVDCVWRFLHGEPISREILIAKT